MAIGDIYQLRDIQAYGLQTDIQNVYYYRAKTATCTAVDLVTAYVTDFLPTLRGVQVSSLLHTRVQAINGMDNSDQFVLDMSQAGIITPPGLPGFICAGFRRRTGGLGYRYAYKRYTAGANTHCSGNTWVESFLEQLEPIANLLGSDLSGTSGDYEPVQITGGFQYGTPPVFKQLLTGNWQFATTLTHQDTRQNYVWVDID